MKQKAQFAKVFAEAYNFAERLRNEFFTPEHVLSRLLEQQPFRNALETCACADTFNIKEEVLDYIQDLEQVPEQVEYKLTPSVMLTSIYRDCVTQAMNADEDHIGVPHLVHAILNCPDSMAHTILLNNINCTTAGLMRKVIDNYQNDLDEEDYPFDDEADNATNYSPDGSCTNPDLQQYTTCMNDHLPAHKELVGRESELDRTIQVLCRMDNNNPLYVGESGVGKTALVWGLVARIEKGCVPDRLQGTQVYQLELGATMAGASYRGEFERRIKSVLDSIAEEEHAILYIDDIHNIVSTEHTNDTMDAAQLLLPYLMDGKIRVIGSTTYQDLNQITMKQKALLRRFQQIDVCEPSIDETVKILEGLKKHYEKFHGVTYKKEVMKYAAKMSHDHISGRFLPNKAIDLIDEAGAYLETHPNKDVKHQMVTCDLVAQVLSKICKVNAEVLTTDSNQLLATLGQRIRQSIYGQDEAVDYVVRAVEMAKAGLLDTNKPMASLLFVGPTGVGKTELCRVLAQELGIGLVRFDMSEYTEKHTVAKLIGSPAGYVGYEDGGLLTDAIHKTPNCVLLLDEIEKAHSDIYNILLQVMDYACLTDNRGNKADFRNVIVVMTSNAGAQYAHQANVGFATATSVGDAMLTQVKKTFKPEFLNRLSGTVVFHDMDRTMAERILDKKIIELQHKLDARKVTLQLTPEARSLLLEKGYTRQYGAREMDRVIQQMVVPVLLKEILYGDLSKGGTITLDKDGLLIG